MSVKENANPQIYVVDRTKAHPSINWITFLGISPTTLCDGDGDNSNDCFDNDGDQEFPITVASASEMAILKSLIDCSRATNGSGVRLLRHAGLFVPNSHSATKEHQPDNGSHPSRSVPFQVVAEEKQQEDSDDKNNSTSIDISTTNLVQSDGNFYSITANEIFDIIRTIQDPEHPHTLEQLGVVSLEQVHVTSKNDDSDDGCYYNGSSTNNHLRVQVRFTPTIPHCSMATLIGLCLRVKLMRSLPPTAKIQVEIEPGTHASEHAINKQLRDKERVCAALENKHLAGVVNKCIAQGMQQQ
jgi:metal-sulfur cluster biosynthetic enzyme